MQSFLLWFFFIYLASVVPCTRAWMHHYLSVSSSRFSSSPTTPSTTHHHHLLRMGLFDSLSNIFLQDREGDFVKLEEHEEEYGPGPAVVLYNVPTNLLDDELTDMLEDGAPKATKKGISMTRIITAGGVVNEDLLDLSVQEALERVVSSSKSLSSSSPPSLLSTDAGILSTCPVLLFSGFSNKEMMDSYNIIAEEIYKEMAGQAIMAACAKAVPNAMLKPLRQMLQEICGDHQDAMRQDDF